MIGSLNRRRADTCQSRFERLIRLEPRLCRGRSLSIGIAERRPDSVNYPADKKQAGEGEGTSASERQQAGPARLDATMAERCFQPS